MSHGIYENDCTIVGPRGELVFDGVDLGRLARERETPFFLISQGIMEQNYRRLVEGFSTVENFGVYYSVKTNFETGVLQTIRDLGAGAEISGDLDLHVVLKTGFTPDKIVFDGPCKTDRELEHAIQRGIRLINVESVDEIRRVDALAKAHGRVVDIGVRLDPLTRGPVYDKLITTYKQKFGFLAGTYGEAFTAIRACRNLRLIGLHAHIGSQIMNPALYVEALTTMFREAADLRRSGSPSRRSTSAEASPPRAFGPCVSTVGFAAPGCWNASGCSRSGFRPSRNSVARSRRATRPTSEPTASRRASRSSPAGCWSTTPASWSGECACSSPIGCSPTSVTTRCPRTSSSPSGASTSRTR